MDSPPPKNPLVRLLARARANRIRRQAEERSAARTSEHPDGGAERDSGRRGPDTK